jgi:hypothetical protein
VKGIGVAMVTGRVQNMFDKNSPMVTPVASVQIHPRCG